MGRWLKQFLEAGCNKIGDNSDIRVLNSNDASLMSPMSRCYEGGISKKSASKKDQPAIGEFAANAVDLSAPKVLTSPPRQLIGCSSVIVTPGNKEVVENVTAVINQVDQKNISKLFKRANSSSPESNLDLKRTWPKTNTAVMRPSDKKLILPAPPIVHPHASCNDFNIASFIADLDKVGISFAHGNEGLQLYIDAATLTSADTMNMMAYMKKHMANHKDKIAEYLKQRT